MLGDTQMSEERRTREEDRHETDDDGVGDEGRRAFSNDDATHVCMYNK